VEEVVQDVNRFLRGWAGYFRYGNSARHLALVRTHATGRLALLVAKRHRRARSHGWRAVVYRSPDRYGLIDLSGSVVAPRPTRRSGKGEHRRRKDVGEPGAENRMPGSMRRREESGANGLRAPRRGRLPPTLPRP
jgi:Group II intron, maturase-specific domain